MSNPILDQWKKDTTETIQFHLDHDELGMAFRAYILAAREMFLMYRSAKLAVKIEKWQKDVDAFNAMADMKADLRKL